MIAVIKKCSFSLQWRPSVLLILTPFGDIEKHVWANKNLYGVPNGLLITFNRLGFHDGKCLAIVVQWSSIFDTGSFGFGGDLYFDRTMLRKINSIRAWRSFDMHVFSVKINERSCGSFTNCYRYKYTRKIIIFNTF